MLSGFNTNVRHRGLLLHVQTEDSGRAHPHIITHLYHGGTILASERSHYGERLESGDLAAEVRTLMEAQHRDMLRRLKRGELDARLVERLGQHAFPGEPGAATASGATASGATASTLPGATGPTSPAVSAGEGAGISAAGRPPVAGAADERPLDELVLEYLIGRAAGPPRPAS